MAVLRGDMVCDGCDGYFDGDPLAQLFETNTLANTLQNPNSRHMVANFWLCGECSPSYPGGAKEFFSSDVWDDFPVCSRCDYQDVDEWGHVCDYCEDDII